MDKVDILTSSRVDALSQHRHATIISRLGPTLAYAVHVQSIIGSLSVFLCWRAYLVASVSLVQAYYATRLLTWGTKQGAWHGVAAAAAVWDMKTTRVLRDKIFYEFALFVLGAGNGLFLVVLWPGWIVIGGTSFVLWQMCG
ncbi:hypothetical protein CCM_03994 [Cordyceps militaris CM01]|uniref:Uncharacterized protein n=1 Tax=Cordyceps militaris (strain CM01) TaxID=983644 RepID=G3JDE6_CORMM|nr:uncharacterized protein CCM_03994 [Cordyceps militaris CM01]EGX92621.1 hypothetical protein CCM_03994 [Cordyceps militaris CM01]